MMKKTCIVLGLIVCISSNVFAKSKEVEVPRTALKDSYKYYVLEETKKNTLFQVTYKRLSPNSFDYGIVEINCPSKVIRLLGKGTQLKGISTANPSAWQKPVIGTIESDMIAYVCR